ncbi:MAG: hypothetical protein EOO90_09780 [Pedobacter sp.]|nr:MAG: hypothetical protein EOO90_09780 [Pedobacter sp.]
MSFFTCLYLLENPDSYILEIKRNDLDENAAISDKFRWLKIEKENRQINNLTFRSMDSAGDLEERFFEEGYLKFDDKIGTFIEKFNSAQHPLVRVADCEVSEIVEVAIEQYILELNQL